MVSRMMIRRGIKGRKEDQYDEGREIHVSVWFIVEPR
jgi:hypothetical protein